MACLTNFLLMGSTWKLSAQLGGNALFYAFAASALALMNERTQMTVSEEGIDRRMTFSHLFHTLISRLRWESILCA